MNYRINSAVHADGTPRKRSARRIAISTGLLVSSLGLALGSATVASAASKPKLEQFNINVAIPVLNVNTIPFWVGQQQGIFAKYGLNIKLVTLNSSSNVSLALSSNSVQVGNETPIGLVQAYSNGEHLVSVGAFNQGLPGAVVVSDKYMAAHGLTAKSTPEEVAKALVGSTFASSSTSTLGQAAGIMRSLGVSPTSYKVVNLASAPAEVTAMQTGAIDWFFANYPTPLLPVQNNVGTVLMTSKNTKFIDTTSYNQVIAMNSDYAAAHPALAKRIVKAFSEASAYVRNHETQSISVAQSNLPGYTRANMLKSIAAVNWDRSPVQSEQTWRTSEALNVKTGQIGAGVKIVENGIWTNKYT